MTTVWIQRMFALCAITLMAPIGCKKTTLTQQSTVKDFAYDASARNFAILAGSDGSQVKLADGKGAPVLAGVPPDIASWWSFFCGNTPLPAGGVKVPVLQTSASANSPENTSKPTICTGLLGTFEMVYVNQTTTSAEDLRAAMRWVGANLEAKSTLVVAYSGHGSETGTLFVNPETPWWPFGDILAEEPRRRDILGKRFYFFNDSCYSGKLVNSDKSAILYGGRSSASADDGQILPFLADGYNDKDAFKDYRRSVDPTYVAPSGASLTGASKSRAAGDPLAAKNNASTEAIAQAIAKGPAFEQAIIFSAATQAETASDLGAGGGAFTSTLREVFEFYFKNYKPEDPTTNPSLQRVFNDIAWRVQNKPGMEKRQVPQYRVAPECLLNEKFLITGQPTKCVAAIGTPEGPPTSSVPTPTPRSSPSSSPSPAR